MWIAFGEKKKKMKKCKVFLRLQRVDCFTFKAITLTFAVLIFARSFTYESGDHGA